MEYHHFNSIGFYTCLLKIIEMSKIKENKDIQAHELENLQIFPNARIYETKLTEKFKSRVVWKKPNPQEIKSIIPGSVTTIYVNIGQSVTKGEALMSYEAMKMHNIVQAPFDGVIEKIFVSEGESLPKGVVMIYLKSSQPINLEIEEDTTSSDLGLIV